MQPKQIGNYTLVEIIVRNAFLTLQGKGGYGTVFVGKKGENTYSSFLIARYAIKEVPLDQHEEDDEAALQDYFKEVQIFKSVSRFS